MNISRMPLYRTLFLLASILLVVYFTGCQTSGLLTQSSAPSDTTVVATFADEQIDLDEFEQRYVRAVGGVDRARQDSLEQYSEFLERYVNFRLKLLDAKRRGLEADLYGESDITTRPGELARSFLVSQRQQELLEELYERRQQEVDISAITIRFGTEPTPEDTLEAYRKIRDVRDSIRAGMSFADAAVRFSDASSAERDSGRIGYLSAGQAYQSFENRMYDTPVGEISDPFRSRYGYYLMKVHDRRPAHPERRLSHIMVTPNDDDTTRAYEAILQLRDSVEAGKDFSRLASQYSAHRETAGQGGDFGWMSYLEMERVVPDFAKAAWAIDTVGAVSDEIVRSRFGYHLVKITDERDYSSLETARPHLMEQLEQLPRSQNLENKVARRLLRKHEASVDSAVVQAAIDQLPADSSWSSLVENGFGSTFQDRAFASIGDSTYTLSQLAATLQDRNENTITDQVHANIDQFLNEKVFDYEAPLLRAENPEFARIVDEYEQGLLLFKVSGQVVWDKAQEDTTALRELYRESADQYQWPRRYRTVVFRTLVDSTLKPVVEGLREGADVTTVRERLTKRDYDVTIDTVFVSDPSHEMYGQVFDLNPGEHTDIISHGARDMVLLLDEIEQPRQKTFEEARTEVVRKYQEQLEREWMADLHERYDVSFYPERLRHAFADTTVPGEPLDNRLPSNERPGR